MAAGSNGVMEPSDNCSQSTPPLSGVWGNGVPHSNLGYSSERTPVLRVQKLPYRLVTGRGGEVGDRETTPLLSQERGGGGGVGQERGREEVVGEGAEREEEREEVVGEIIENLSETGTPEDQPQEVGGGGKEEKRQLLSLRRGKKRSSGNFSTSLSPSDKKPRLDPEDTSSTAGVPGEQSAVSPQQRTVPISQSVGKRQADKGDKLGQLPEMFAPGGVPTAVYTATILNVFNSYIQQLREAQGKVLSLIPWSKPIPSSLRQPLTSLTWRPAPPHRAARPAGHHHNWPSIDLRSGEVVRSSPGSSSARRTGCQRRRRRANIEEDDDEEFLPPSLAGGSGTPSRPQISLKQKDTETAESGRKWFIPSECPSVGKSRESTSRVVSSPDSPPHLSHKKLLPSPVNSDLHTDRPGNTAETNSNTMLHTSPEAETLSMSLSLSAGEGSGETMAEVEDSHLTPSHGGGEGVGEDEPQDGGEGGRKGDREVGGGGGGGGNGEVASSAEDADDVLFCGQRRKRTKLFDDSDSENECGSKSSHAGDDVICAMNSKPATREEPEEGKKSSLFARARAAFGGGKRTKRQSFQPLPVRTVAGGKPCSAEPGDSVVDLTEEPTAVEEKIDHGQQQVEEEEVEVVACPLCSELFSHSSIEAHAASCGETRETSSKSYGGLVGKRVGHQLPLRQSSLITPRFTR